LLTGASAGEITGHSKSITTCAFRPAKPYRVVTGGEDFVVCWFEGPPFKWKHSIPGFSNFVNCVKFSPDGKQFFMVGQDKKGYFGDGETGKVTFELDAGSAHTGGIYACHYSPDGSQVLTVSGDKTAKIWDSSNGKCVKTYSYGKELEDQLLGCLWQGNHKIVMNLAGHLIYLPDDPSSPPARVIKGHNKSVDAMAYDASTKSIYSGSYDTVINKWSLETGEAVSFKGKGHTNQIKGVAIQGGNLVTAALDDTLRITPLSTLEYASSNIPLGGPAVGVAVAGSDTIVTATNKAVLLLKGGKIVDTKKADALGPQAVAISPDGNTVAVGGDNNTIQIYKVNGNSLAEGAVLKEHRGPLSKLAYSPDGKLLASADRNREIFVWDVATNTVKISETKWVFHTARIDGLQFSPDSKHVASGGLDQTIIIWSIDEPTKRVTIKGAHQGGINEVVWLDNKRVLTTGQDATLRSWNVL
jgi:WD40 repeat protein